MSMQDILEDQAAVASDDDIRTRRISVVAQEADDDDLDDDDLDEDLDEDLDDDEEIDDDLDEDLDEDDDDEEWEDEPDESADTVISAEQADAGQYVAEKPAKLGRDDDSAAAAG